MSEEKIKEIQFPQIAEEIIRMAEIDQDFRHRAMEHGGIIDEKDKEIDKNNTERMREIVNEIGWPTISKVGADASRCAWLLVQHADHDAPFQQLCLELMKRIPLEDIDPKYIAYLEDRVRVNTKRPQIYGTQFYKNGEGEFVPRPIENEGMVEDLRKEKGLITMEENKKRMAEKYKKYKS